MRAAVWGSPIAHSLSPALHRAAYAALELDWRYGSSEVDAAALPAAVAALDSTWAGVSLTMPLKAEVLPLLAETSPLALAVGAVNTLLPLPGAPGAPLRWRGENTDVHGVVAALAEVGVRAAGEVVGGAGARARSAVVLGGGATAASALAALAQLGVREPVVVVRSPERARALVDVGVQLGVAVQLHRWPEADAEPVAALLARADVVVSTAPVGAADAVADALAGVLPAGGAPAGALLDVVYAPWPTALGAAWAAAGGPVVGGFSMLLHQACRQVELMTGRVAPVEAMRAAGPAVPRQLLTR